MGAVAIVGRADWGARPPRRPPVQMAGSEGCWAHHTTGSNLGSPNSYEWIRAIQAFHMDARGYNDIAYSFLFDRTGLIFVGRGWGIVGAHTLGSDGTNYNPISHGFAYLGDGREPVTDAALAALRWLVAEHDNRFGAGYLQGHRDVASTVCCGDVLYAALPTIRDQPPPTADPAPNWTEEILAMLTVLDYSRPEDRTHILVDNMQGLLKGTRRPECDPGAITGKWDAKTTAALLAFRDLIGQAPHPVCDEMTWQRLVTW